jgi:hypothetical protein
MFRDNPWDRARAVTHQLHDELHCGLKNPLKSYLA